MCIDPQQQALNWIKKKEEKNSLKVQKQIVLIQVMCHKSWNDFFQQIFGKTHYI